MMATEKEPNLQTVPAVQAQFLRSQYRRGPQSLMACRSDGRTRHIRLREMGGGKRFFPRPPNLPLTAASRQLSAPNGGQRRSTAVNGT